MHTKSLLQFAPAAARVLLRVKQIGKSLEGLSSLGVVMWELRVAPNVHQGVTSF